MALCTAIPAQDIILENFNDLNEYSETWGAEWSNVATDTASYGGGTSPTLANRGFATRSSNNGPAPLFQSPVSNSDKATSWVADGVGGYAIRYGDGGITAASNSNTAQRHHSVQVNLAKVGNYRANSVSFPVIRYWDNLPAQNRRFLRLTAWRDSSPNNDPSPTNTAKFVVGATSPPTSNCAVPDSSIGPWSSDGSTLEGFAIGTTKQAFVIDLTDTTRFKADPVYRVNVRLNTFGTCSTANVQSAVRADLTKILSFNFGYWRSGTSAGTALDPIRFYVDDIILMGRMPGYDTTPSLTLVQESGPGNESQVSMVLAAIPSHPVTVNVASTQPGNIALSTNTLTFTPANWNVPQVITATAVDNAIPDHGTRTASLVFSKGATNDLLYAGSSVAVPTTISLTVQDVASAGYSLTTHTATLEELGPNSSTTASVVLTSIPTSPVTLTPSSSDVNAMTVAGGPLVFDNTNWNIPQIVTLTAVDDNIIPGGNRSAQLQWSLGTACPFYTGAGSPNNDTVEIVNNGLPVSLTHMTVE